MDSTNSKIFRTIVVLAIACYGVLLAIPYLPIELDPEAVTLLVYHGSLAALPGLTQLIFYPFVVLWMTAYLGLFFYKRWARGLFVGLYIAGITEGLLGGLDVYMPWDSTLITLFVLCDGAIFALAFTQPLAARFSAKLAASNQRA